MKKYLPRIKTSDKRGFTLIELMVVITILAFLAVIGFASYTTFSKNARDARRKADIEAISSALEANMNSDGTYKCGQGASAVTSIYANGTVPTDPDTAKSYTLTYYTSTNASASCGATDAVKYTICSSALENTAGGNAGSATPSITAAWSGTTHYCLKNRQ